MWYHLLNRSGKDEWGAVTSGVSPTRPEIRSGICFLLFFGSVRSGDSRNGAGRNGVCSRWNNNKINVKKQNENTCQASYTHELLWFYACCCPVVSVMYPLQRDSSLAYRGFIHFIGSIRGNFIGYIRGSKCFIGSCLARENFAGHFDIGSKGMKLTRAVQVFIGFLSLRGMKKYCSVRLYNQVHC